MMCQVKTEMMYSSYLNIRSMHPEIFRNIAVYFNALWITLLVDCLLQYAAQTVKS